MQSVGTKNTGPELVVRRLLYRLGYRYRLHNKKLPGRPDIVFLGRSKVIFVHGCFWHGHGCQKGQAPKSRLEYWLPKIESNRTRDSLKTDELKQMGFSVLTIWQCELLEAAELQNKLINFLKAPANFDRLSSRTPLS
jgi:DNA mismatch endonuclease (patch repair protein)